MNYIGIDFSINSTSVCVQADGIDHTHVFPKNRKPKSNSKSHKLYNALTEEEGFTVHDYSFTANDDYSLREVELIRSANVLGNLVSNVVSMYPDAKIGIEGFSYASNGRSFIDMIIYNSIMRLKLMETNTNIIFVPPSNLKMWANGKGNADKFAMIESFLSKSQESKLHSFIKKHYDKNDLLKPIDDMVDSFFLKEYVKNGS